LDHLGIRADLAQVTARKLGASADIVVALGLHAYGRDSHQGGELLGEFIAQVRHVRI
jgi:hypothetical protein